MHTTPHLSLISEAGERLYPLIPLGFDTVLVTTESGDLALTLKRLGCKATQYIGDVVSLEQQLERAGFTKRCHCGELIARDMRKCAECEKCSECGREEGHDSDCPLRPSVAERREEFLANRYS